MQDEQETIIDQFLEEQQKQSSKDTLSNEHKAKILEMWNSRKDNPPSIMELVQACFGEQYDGRSPYGKLIKAFLASREIVLDPLQPVKQIELTDEQKEFISNNLSKFSKLEMVRQLFNNENLSSLSSEARKVYEYINSLPSNVARSQEQPGEAINESKSYRPPKSTIQAAQRVNKYILDCIDVKDINDNSKVQEYLRGVIRFTHMYRFVNIYNNLKSEKDKDLFEASYIRFIFDKPDLQEMELDLVCNLCCDIVNYTNMQKELDQLKIMRDDCLDDSDGKRMSMSLVQEMGNIRKEMDDNHKRQITTAKMLEGTRNERIDLKNRENATLTQLIDFCRNHENRKQLAALAEIRRNKIKKEVHKIKNLDDLKVQIWGITEEELIH